MLISLRKLEIKNLVNLNAVKSQCCLISRSVDRNLPDMSVDFNPLEFTDKISMLGVILGSHLFWNVQITSVAKAVLYRLGIFHLFMTHIHRYLRLILNS